MMKSRYAILSVMLSLILLAWVVACAGTDTMMDTPMDAAMDGMLAGSEGHHAAGKVTIDKGMGGPAVLILSDIEIDKVPDGHVYLTRGGDWMHGVELGRLTQFSGTVSFDIPPGVKPDDFDSVVVWCKKFNTEIGRATLPNKMM
jgi:hypothetical protein